MANYTKITTHLAQDILKLYAIENITALHSTSTGISNTNYLVEVAGEKKFILKISNSKLPDSLEQEQDILEYLKRQNYPYNLVALKNIDGKRVYRHENLCGVVYPFVTGETPHLNQNNVFEMGKALAQLHQIKIDGQTQLREFSQLGFDIENILSYVKLENALKPFTDYFYELININKVAAYHSLIKRKCILHGDLYFDNFLFNADGKIACVLDFEQSGIGDPMIDIGISISGSCHKNGELQQELIEAFLQGYQQICPLRPEEKSLVDFSILMGLFSIALWRIERFNTKKIDISKQDNYLELLKRAKQYARK